LLFINETTARSYAAPEQHPLHAIDQGRVVVHIPGTSYGLDERYIDQVWSMVDRPGGLRAGAFDFELSSSLAERIAFQAMWNLPRCFEYQAELSRFLIGPIHQHQAEN
jgi:hypothetical protein